MRNDSVLHQLARLPQLLVFPLTLVLANAAKKSPAIVESVYSHGLYPPVRNAISKLTGIVPFSIAEVSAICLAVLAAVLLVIRIVKLLSFKKEAFVRLMSFVISIAIFAAYLGSAFYFLWGFNYYRVGIGEKLDLPEREYTAAELEELCVYLTDRANGGSAEVERNEDGVFVFSTEELRQAVKEAYDAYGKAHPSFEANVPRIKPLITSEVFSSLGISGIFIFLTEEPNVNVNEPALYTGLAAAHETAHYIGYAAEEDANFLGYLVCEASESCALKYSAYMHALTHCSSALYRIDKEAYSRVRTLYGPYMELDLKDYSKHCDKYKDSKLMETSEKVNDSYLKANGQEKGVASYEEDVALLLRYYDSCGLFN